MGDKTINNYNKIFMTEHLINYILIIILILLTIGVIYYIKVNNIKFINKPKQKHSKIHTKLHNQSKEKNKNNKRKKNTKKRKKNKKK